MTGAVATRASSWSDTAIAHLEDSLSCPRCAHALHDRHCARCGADYSGPVGGELWEASRRAADALRERRQVLDRVPTRAVAPSPPVAAPPPPVAPVPAVAPGPPRSSATVQSVLAVAGAALVAVAAVVFTSFNPDLTDVLVRGLIVGAVTVVFVVGAAVLMRRGLGFSAEAVGALAIVFVALDVHALTGLAPDARWAVAAPATLVAGVALTALALRLRVRVWLWSALVALAVVPAMIGYAADAPVLGHLGVAVAPFGLISLTPRFGLIIGGSLRAERATLTVVQVLAVVVAPVQGLLWGALPAEAVALSLSGVLAGAGVLAAFSTRHPARGLWSLIAGVWMTAAIVLLTPAVLPPVVWEAWWLAIVPAAAVIGAVVVGVLAPLPRSVDRGVLAVGAVVVMGVAAVPPTVIALLLGGSTVLRDDSDALAEPVFAVAVVLGLAALAVGLVVFAVLRERRHPSPAPAEGAPAPLGTRWVGYLGLWYALLAVLTLLTVPSIAVGGRIAIGLVVAATLSVAVVRTPRLRPLALRAPTVAGAHLLVLFAAILSWRDAALAVTVGAAVVVVIGALALALPARVRFAHVAAGYAYALAVFATALSLAGVTGVAQLCLTTSAGAVTAIAATFAPFVRVRAWYAVLVVTSVPFLLGVAQVLFERSGWTALSTSLIFALALALVATRRPGLVAPLRLAAAAILVPSVAVVAVCLGAQVLPGSGSPVVLPIIAAVVAVVLPCGPLVSSVLAARVGEKDAALARLAIEASTLLTAAIAVGLALVREAAGLGTSLLVLAIVGVGGIATGLWGSRKYGWWLAGAAFTGVVWCAWGIASVGLVEAYVLPPALSAMVVGAVLTARETRSLPLYGAGLLAAVVPALVLAALVGPSARAFALVGAAWVLVAVSRWVLRGPLRSLAPATLGAAMIAGAAGAAGGVRFGLGLDVPPAGASLVLLCLGISVAGAAPALLAARGLRRAAVPGGRLERSRWTAAPAFAYVAVGTWTAIERYWPTIWTMWALMLAFLVAMVVIAACAVRGRTALPPVWFVFALAFATGVVAWSPRELRVEWFSLPLGAALLIAGVFALRAAPPADPAAPGIRSLTAWPARWVGSWPLLAPGLVVMMSASIVATFTDPLTWRAILVIVLALLAILVGAARRLAAPFLIGVVVLPIENVFAFAVQIGRGIESMPWWITLAVVGAVLLIIAVTYERRAGEEAGITARLKDLN
ncbi:hypothetical protein QL996_09715 [Planococcus sp. APC 4015]|nr:hypothetical protein [Planococcus sp. APC 4015]